MPNMSDDLWKALGIGIFGLFVVHGNLEPRVRRDAVEQVQEGFQKTGTVRASVKARGMLGYLANDLYSVDIYGKDNRAKTLPFQVYPRGGWKGSIRHLRVHLENFDLNGVKVSGLEADVPFVKYDITRAMVHGRLHFRGAEPGTATVTLSPENVQGFLVKRFGALVSDAHVVFEQGKVVITGRLLVLASRKPFRSVSGLGIREGKIELVNTEFFLDDKPVPSISLAGIMKQLNPVLDVERDLRMQGVLSLKSVAVTPSGIRVDCDLRLPIHEESLSVKPVKAKPHPIESPTASPQAETTEREGEEFP